MTPFLKQVAGYYFTNGELEKKCFVFPNRRSMIFFSKYLGESLRSSEDSRPLILPQMYTINDLFFKLSGKCSSDRIALLLDLYECYKQLNPKAEETDPLDEFIFWGDIILSDFNDVDKYLVDPQQIFTNVADFKQIQDTYSYLTDNQREAIEAFIGNFRDGAGKLTVDLHTDNPDVKARFLAIWNILYDLYKNFNAHLAEKGMAYEGMVYRELALRLDAESAEDVMKSALTEVEKFVFVGLNALNECEKVLLRKLKTASLAEFCWDYSGKMVKDPQNRSSVFMSENVQEFPQVTSWDEDQVGLPEINVVEVSSSVGQAKRLQDILKQTEGYVSDCAIVLPDEHLLVPVLNSIPETVEEINVTMGLPMSDSLIYSFMSTISTMLLHVSQRNGKWMFYHRPVWEIFASPLFKAVADEQTMDIVEKVKKNAKYYIPQDELAGTELMDAIFQPVVKDQKLRSVNQIKDIEAYMKNLISKIALSISTNVKMATEVEYARLYYNSINILEGVELDIFPVTYMRLLTQLLSSVSVPFKGEPLKGLQIMGPLETRALDFKNLIVLSVNEGVFPRRNVSSSFIPPELRKGFALPTYEYQDAVWAYYFYRMITRAEKVWLLTDSRTDGLKSGEESRYIKQLEYHFGLPLNRYVVKFDKMKVATVGEIAKKPEDVEVIKNKRLSPSTINTYISCPAKFYYSVIEKLAPEQEVVESVDASTLGNVFHEVMRSMYTCDEAMKEDFYFDPEGRNEKTLKNVLTTITKDRIEAWLKREDEIKNKIKSLIIRKLNTVEVSGRNIIVADVILQYVKSTLKADLELMKEHKTSSFKILGRELELKGDISGQKFKGVIDRLDSFEDGTIRVVDYKTGKVLKDDVSVADGKEESVADKIFAKDVKERPSIALQCCIYDRLLEKSEYYQNEKIYNSIYSTVSMGVELPASVEKNDIFADAVDKRLTDLLSQMRDLNVPFARTKCAETCEYCDFKNICGR